MVGGGGGEVREVVGDEAFEGNGRGGSHGCW